MKNNTLNKKILVVGDIHSRWKYLNALIKETNPELILQVGDLGYWPRQQGKISEYDIFLENKYGIKAKPFEQYGIANGDIPIYFAAGNHEDWDSLDKLKNNEVMPNVFYMKFGSCLTLPDGRVVMFCGGAYSIDKEARVLGRDWFEQEIITYADMTNLPDTNKRVDIVISHTCPEEFLVQMSNRNIIYYNQWGKEHRDSSRQALSYIRDTWKPKYWYFGHFHRYTHGNWKETKWFSINMPLQTGWWKYLR